MTTPSSTKPLDDRQIQKTLDDPNLSSLQKYALLAVGSASLGKLILYELVITLFSGFPGALGYWLRRKTYRCLFKSMGRHVTIGRNASIRGPGRISLGDNVLVDDNGVLDARGAQSSVVLENNVLVARNSIVRCRGESLRIGEGTEIGVNCLIATDSRLDIGKDVLIAAYVYVAAGGSHKHDDKTIPIKRQGFERKGGITIGDGCWIGAHSTLIDGVTVGRDTIVGAHSLVTRSLPELVVAMGVPAEVRKQR